MTAVIVVPERKGSGTTPPRRRARPEDNLQTAVLDLCKHLGLRTAHFRPAMTARGTWVTAVAGDGKGFPDLVVVGPGGVLYRELKSATGSLKPEQRTWLDVLRGAGQDADVWRPKDLASGRVKAELQAIRRQVAR